MSLFTPEEREETARRVSRLLGSDDRIDGVVIVGSLAGKGDRWSDIDIEVIVADDEELPAVRPTG
jgi:predicted nucleotidyltransferase